MMVRVCVAMICVSFVGLCGRLLARRLTKQPLLWDDWLIVVGLVFAWSCCIIQLIGVRIAHYGRHAHYATPESTVKYFQLLYALQITYPLAITFVKFSIILFYRRIFHVPSTVKPLLAIGIIVAAWSIAMVLVAIFSCVPVHAFWTMEEPRTCVKALPYFLGVAIPNVTTDVVMLLLPIPWIWKLVISLSQKIALSLIFILGGFVTIISALRMVTVIETQGQMDFTWSLVPLGIWNVVETNVGVLLACLPSMRPLLNILMGKKVERRSLDSSDSRRSFVSGCSSKYHVQTIP